MGWDSREALVGEHSRHKRQDPVESNLTESLCP